MKLTSFMRRSAGFTIIELVASVAIIGILASVAMPVIQTAMTRQKEAQLRAALISIRGAIDAYKQATVNGNIPKTSINPNGYPPLLTTLTGGVTDELSPTKAQIYFLRSIPRDPFFPDQTTPAVDTWTIRSFASPPEAPEKGDDVFDVQSMSSQAGLNGVPYNQW